MDRIKPDHIKEDPFPADGHMLEIDSVELSFRERNILSGVYLKVETGKVTSLLGRNGCGKTCLMNILAGFLNPCFKSVRIDGRWKKSLGHKEIRYLPQYSFLPAKLRLGQAFRDFGIDFGEFSDCFPGFATYENHKAGLLSTGIRRVAECYLILKSPAPFVMLDEPFSQIMPVHVEKIQEIIGKEKKNKGIFLTDHLYRDVLTVTDRLYVMAGRTVYPVQDPKDLQFYGYVSAGTGADM